MTPMHQQLVDELLQQFFRRTDEQAQKCGLHISQPPALEKLRSSLIGQHLTIIAKYIEGSSFPESQHWHDIRDSINEVKRAFFGNPLTSTFYTPPKFHLTPLGRFLNDALVRFYKEQGPGTLLVIGALIERFQVKRQTIHQWISDGLITPVYIDGTTRFYQPDVERLQLVRAQMKKR